MKKSLTFFVIIFCLFISTANAYISNDKVEDCLYNFIYCLDSGDKKVYEYVDTTNEKLYNNLQSYLNSIYVLYDVEDIEANSECYTVKVKFKAEGIGWNVSGYSANFNIKEIDGTYKIVDTDFFDKVGTENVLKYIGKIFLIIFVIFIVAGIIITIIVVRILKKKRNKK